MEIIMDNTNLDDLMSAASQKLVAQQAGNSNEDIYADIRQESDIEEIGIPEIMHTGTVNEFDGNINNDSIPEEPYAVSGDMTPVFEGGPNVAQVEIWKKQYDKEKVFHTKVLDRHFIFRTLNRFEYKQIVAIDNIDALYREEIICNTCVLFPLNYDFKTMAAEDSGYPSTLAQIIMENSGFTKEYSIEIL